MNWQPLKIGAGGQLTGIDIHNDGTMVVRADTYGAYYWDPAAASPGNAGGSGKWLQLYNSSSIPGAAVADPYSTLYGCYEIRIAPNNSSRFYMYDANYIYTTTNKGLTWTKTTFNSGLTVAPADSNVETKFLGPFLAIDPWNELICFTGTPGLAPGSSIVAQGVYYTIDGGSNWTHISTGTIAAGTGVPAGVQQGGNCVAFDPLSSHPGTPAVTQTLYISSYGTGVYQSTNGGQTGGSGTWTLLSGALMPTDVKKMLVGPDQKLYCIEYGSWNIKVYDGTWHSYTPGTDGGLSVLNDLAFDPANASHVVAVAQSGLMSTTTTGVSGTWSGFQQNFSIPSELAHRIATDIPWLAAPFVAYMTTAMIRFDPSQSNVLYAAAGVGVWKTSDTTVTSTSMRANWTSQSAGIEQMVVDIIISPPGGVPVVAVWDRPVFTISNINQYPTDYGPVYASVSEAFGIDWASTTPATIVVLCSDPAFSSSNRISYSTTGGGPPASWTTVSGVPAGGRGGAIAAASPSNWVVANLFGGLFYTINTGANWLNPTIAGGAITNTDAGWYSFAEALKMQNVCADRVLADTFYAYNRGPTAPGIYVSTDKGANWTKKFTGQLGGGIHSDAAAILRAVPGQSGNFYSTSGPETISIPGPAFDEWTWNGSTLTQNTIASMQSVWGFGFGKVKPGNTYPSVYVYGALSNVFGLYRSDDHCATWTALSNSFVPAWPIAGSVYGSADQAIAIEGDSGTYGTVYVGFNGSGVAYYALEAAANTFGFSVIQGSSRRPTKMVGY